MSRRAARGWVLGLVGVSFGCATSSNTSTPLLDSGLPQHDTGAADGRKADGPTGHEGGAKGDAAHHDAASDAAPGRDSSMTDGSAGALVPAAACTGTAAEVYAAVPNLPPMTNALRGDIVACTSDGTLDVATVQTEMNTEPDTGVTAKTGVAIYRVQFRTTRSNGSDGYSSARIYLPLVPISQTPPVIVAAHGTEGLAASCATTMSATSMEDLALPWASIGYPVIAPDYAGLGTPGTQGYLDNRDTAQSVVDSVEALRKFVAGTLGRQVLIDGHSQGGGAALATQALATQMNLDGDLVAVLTFAPEYFSRMDVTTPGEPPSSVGYLGSLESVYPGNPLTITTGVTKCEVAALIEYAYFANHVPTALPTDGFPSTIANELGQAILGQCTIPLGGAIQFDAPHVADWTEANLRADLLACVTGADGGFGVDGGGSCTGAGQAFHEYLLANVLPPDSSGAKVLLVQGLQDIVMPPGEEAACNVETLKAGGVTPQVCTDATASHTDVVQRNIAFAIQWGQAALAGTALPACAASDLPACAAP